MPQKKSFSLKTDSVLHRDQTPSFHICSHGEFHTDDLNCFIDCKLNNSIEKNDGPFLMCYRCKYRFHMKCTHTVSFQLMSTDKFYVFLCCGCNHHVEFFKLLSWTWVDLMRCIFCSLSSDYHPRTHFDIHTDVIPFVEENFELFRIGWTSTFTKDSLVQLWIHIVLYEQASWFKSGIDMKKQVSVFCLREKSIPDPTVTVPNGCLRTPRQAESIQAMHSPPPKPPIGVSSGYVTRVMRADEMKHFAIKVAQGVVAYNGCKMDNCLLNWNKFPDGSVELPTERHAKKNSPLKSAANASKSPVKVLKKSEDDCNKKEVNEVDENVVKSKKVRKVRSRSTQARPQLGALQVQTDPIEELSPSKENSNDNLETITVMCSVSPNNPPVPVTVQLPSEKSPGGSEITNFLRDATAKDSVIFWSANVEAASCKRCLSDSTSPNTNDNVDSASSSSEIIPKAKVRKLRQNASSKTNNDKQEKSTDVLAAFGLSDNSFASRDLFNSEVVPSANPVLNQDQDLFLSVPYALPRHILYKGPLIGRKKSENGRYFYLVDPMDYNNFLTSENLPVVEFLIS